MHFKNRFFFFFFFNLSHLRQVYSVVSKQEKQAHSSLPAILIRMKSFAHMPSRWNAQTSGIDIIYIICTQRMHLVRHMKSSTSESKSNFCRSIRLRQSNKTAKVRLRFRRRTFHVPNQMHTLRINDINYIYPRGLCIPSTWHVRKGLHSEQDGGKRGMCLFFLFRNN